MPTHIVIPNERAVQLKHFAASLGVTVSEAVGVLINDAIAAGKIPDTIPGVKVERDGEHVNVDFGAFGKSFTLEMAKDYAAQIRASIDPKKAIPVSNQPDRGVVRRGSGIKLMGQKIVAHSVAAEIARLIDRAATDDFEVRHSPAAQLRPAEIGHRREDVSGPTIDVYEATLKRHDKT